MAIELRLGHVRFCVVLASIVYFYDKMRNSQFFFSVNSGRFRNFYKNRKKSKINIFFLARLCHSAVIRVWEDPT
tara:strand:- start:1257 stop:1478 length:222 start_codon:yes stop_codon:yes gene_type:complete